MKSSAPGPHGTLLLSVKKSIDQIQTELPATIRVQHATGGWKQQFLVPIGPDVSAPASIDIPAGVYSVDVQLPSGETISSDGELAAGETSHVVLAGQPSRAESLSWPSFVLRGDFTRKSAPPPLSGLETAARSRSLRAGPKMPAAQDMQCWTHSEGRWSKATATIRLQSNDPDICVYRVEAQQSVLLQLPRPGAAASTFCRVPGDWKTASGEKATVTVVVDTVPGDAAEEPQLRVRSTVNDPQFAKLSGFLSYGVDAGALAIGDQLAKDAENLIERKDNNPLLACAAALVLLKARLPHGLHAWTFRLASFFPQIPDTAIVRAWHLLFGAERQAGERDALDWLLEADRRGVPLYAYSLRLLVDGLKLFEQNHALVADTGRKWQSYLWASAADEAFTRFSGSTPDLPLAPGRPAFWPAAPASESDVAVETPGVGVRPPPAEA
ncbi:hypothetical protein DFR29_10593 [Tahibacter aquaticus]|uniref:Uncharacterized protein n=1 Tax=Tahibacter aquaticus TaxID=520092 RepID=A0A4R6Z072_9GAMM|nr:hypothetical protein [Tahibacter aquaticus]TDR44910.1 hypothetical protein DFR29_10593 [Tahibacter aquaticus]